MFGISLGGHRWPLPQTRLAQSPILDRLGQGTIQSLVSRVSIDVRPAAVNEADRTGAIDQESHGGPAALRLAQPPIAQGFPIAIDRDGEGKPKSLCLGDNMLARQRLIRLVMIRANYHQPLVAIF